MEKDQKTGTRLSPFPYVVHNRARTASLVISLGVFAMMIYVLGYFLGSTVEPFTETELGQHKRYSTVCEYFEIEEEYDGFEEWEKLVRPHMEEMKVKISGILGTDDVMIVKRGFGVINAVLGQTGVPIWYFDNTEDMMRYASHMDAELVEGRWPQERGELVVDTKSYANKGDEILSRVSDSYRIVGKIECPYYTIFGFPIEAENNYQIMILHDDENNGYIKKLEDSGLVLSYKDDYKAEADSYDREIGSLDDIKILVTSVCTMLLSVCIVVVLAIHIKDRHSEWCLINSIGFPVGEIYLMALKELLICFGIAIGLGIVLSAAVVLAMKYLMMEPLGLAVRVIRPEDMGLLLVFMAGIFGVCQIPLFAQLRTITTVDEIE